MGTKRISQKDAFSWFHLALPMAIAEKLNHIFDKWDTSTSLSLIYARTMQNNYKLKNIKYESTTFIIKELSNILVIVEVYQFCKLKISHVIWFRYKWSDKLLSPPFPVGYFFEAYFYYYSYTIDNIAVKLYRKAKMSLIVNFQIPKLICQSQTS